MGEIEREVIGGRKIDMRTGDQIDKELEFLKT